MWTPTNVYPNQAHSEQELSVRAALKSYGPYGTILHYAILILPSSKHGRWKFRSGVQRA